MRYTHNFASGAFFWAVALGYGYMAWRSLPIGEALNMGPGYFPIVLSLLLMLIGSMELVRGFAKQSGDSLGQIAWRPIIVIVLSIVGFALTLRGIGILPAVFLAATAISFASRDVEPLKAVATGAILAIFCTIVFGYGVRLPLPIIGPWLLGRGG